MISTLFDVLYDRDRMALFDPVELTFRDDAVIRRVVGPVAWDSDEEIKSRRLRAKLVLFCAVTHHDILRTKLREFFV